MSKIFISYAHEDARAARRIAEALATAGLEAWIDTEALELGESFVHGMNRGLESASYLLFLVSKQSLSSRWVSMEWMAALSQQETVVIPVMLEPCDLPPLLRHIIYVDASRDLEVGIGEIVEFFQRERQGATRQPPPTRTRSGEPPVSLRGQSRRVLRLVALRCLDDVTLSSFLYDTEIDPGQISGGSLHERILFLLHKINREGLSEDFVEWLMVERARCVRHQLSERASAER